MRYDVGFSESVSIPNGWFGSVAHPESSSEVNDDMASQEKAGNGSLLSLSVISKLTSKAVNTQDLQIVNELNNSLLAPF